MRNEGDQIGVGYHIKKRLSIGQLIKDTNGTQLTKKRVEILENGDIEQLRQIANEYRAKEAEAIKKQRVINANVKTLKAGRKIGCNYHAMEKYRELAACAERVLAKLTGV